MRPAAILVTVALMLVIATPARAAYYIGKPVAESYLRRLLHSYGYSNTSVYCRPQRGNNATATKAGRILYHRWLCGFYAGYPGDSCKAAISIIGSEGPGGFRYYRHYSRGEAC